MAKKDPRFDEYILEAEPFARPVLKHIRKLVHQNCPQVEEALKWGMPHFVYHGKILCGMAAFKAHATLHFWKGAQFIKNPTPGAMGQFGRITSLTQEQQQEIGTLPQQQRIARFAELTGLSQLAAQNGVPAAKASSCIGDTAALQKLVEMRKVAMEQLGVNSTPSFLLNGKPLEGVHDWSALQPHLGLKG